jgi:hypothetical protein
MTVLITNQENRTVMLTKGSQDSRATLPLLTAVGHILTFLSSLMYTDVNKATAQFSIKFPERHFLFAFHILHA